MTQHAQLFRSFRGRIIVLFHGHDDHGPEIDFQGRAGPSDHLIALENKVDDLAICCRQTNQCMQNIQAQLDKWTATVEKLLLDSLHGDNNQEPWNECSGDIFDDYQGDDAMMNDDLTANMAGGLQQG
ncbi:hypothetical protein JX266_014162 [Neoarthrinium moseri]|nr:hypothetical protein JX266_014162 [Neoarthrinium moseri]